MENRIQRFLNFSVNVLLFLICSFGALTFYNTSFSQYESIARYVAKESTNNLNQKVYSYTFCEKAEYNSELTSIYNSEYGLNFNNYFTETLSYFDDNGSLLKINVNCNGNSITECVWCDLSTYSNQDELKRFEKININLLELRDKHEETNSFGLDGFIYIPDYFADTIIQNSNGELSNYYDLIPDLENKTLEERDAFLDKYSIVFNNFYGEQEKYKIANIFHVNGFADAFLGGQYVYNDDYSSQLLKTFLGDYAFLYSEKSKLKDFKKTLVSVYDAKQFLIEERMQKFGQNDMAKKFKMQFCSVTANKSSNNVSVLEIQTPAFSNTSLFVVFLPFFIICILLLAFIVFLRIKFRIFFTQRYFVIMIPVLICIFLIIQLAQTLIPNLIMFRITNSGFMATLLLCLLGVVSLFFVERQIKNV